MKKGEKMSEEIKLKISESEKVKIVSDSTKKKMSMSQTGKRRSPEAIRKVSVSNTGKKRSEESKIRYSVSKMGNKNPQFGRHPSAETLLKRSVSMRGKNTWTKGRITSEETKNRLREITIHRPNRNFKNTSIELKVEKELQKRGILYSKQFSLLDVAIVDFYLPELKSVIQCDGCYWHNCLIHHPTKHIGARDKDERQDAALEEAGYRVYRLWEHDINNPDKHYPSSLTIDQLLNFLIKQ